MRKLNKIQKKMCRDIVKDFSTKLELYRYMYDSPAFFRFMESHNDYGGMIHDVDRAVNDAWVNKITKQKKDSFIIEERLV